MRSVVITEEQILDREWQLIERVLEEGIDALHLRKPSLAADEMRELLQRISPEFHSRIILHDHLSLVDEFSLGGVHLNRRSPHPPCGYEGQISTSCHTLKEVAAVTTEVSYSFLSPIYNSISKSGYESHFSHEELTEARERGVIGERVVALGGVTPDRIDELREYGFGGVALLGYVWQGGEIGEIGRRAREIVRLTKE